MTLQTKTAQELSRMIWEEFAHKPACASFSGVTILECEGDPNSIADHVWAGGCQAARFVPANLALRRASSSAR